ncbi:MAG: ATP-binding cassette domain-containing protein [Desulfohalobiaceae bacterium]
MGDREIIRVEDLTVGYGGTSVLEGVSFSVYEGEIFAILGSSGCGKSTLFHALIGLLPIQKGRIIIAGEEIGPGGDEESLRRIRRQIGVLFQSGALLDWLSVGENIAFPLRESTDLPEEIIQQVVQLKLKLVRLEGCADKKPAELSGGMTRRAGLAAGMARDPRILFCDEPTFGLDPNTAMEIDELLIEMRDHLNVTIGVVTHVVPTLENIATRCIMLDKQAKGIIASGDLEDLKNDTSDSRVQTFFQRRIPNRRNRE